MPDIKTTGSEDWRTLQQENAKKQFNPNTATDQDWSNMARSMFRNIGQYNPKPSESIGLKAAEVGYGNSQYDDAVTSASQLDDLNEIRYAEQPWYDTLANGVGKMLGTAATTFASSLIGLPAGLVTAAVEWDSSGIWDNAVTNFLGDVDDWMEKNMTNYQSEAQQNAKWYQRLGDMNWWADSFIKNVGFTLGAGASMAVGSGALGLMSRAMGMVNKVGKGTKMVSNAASALFSATGEGMIEARQGVEDRNRLEEQRLKDALAPEQQALDLEQQMIDEEYAMDRSPLGYQRYMQRSADLAQRKALLNERYEQGMQEIEESGKAMGNKILLGNQILLSAGNLIQFGKAMTKSFDKARHAAEVAKKAKPAFANAERVSSNLADGYKVTGKTAGRIHAGTKGLLTEGSEEMNQQWISSGAGAMYKREDANDYWKAKMDPQAIKDTTYGLYALGKGIAKGFDDSWGDFDQWEQFVIGGITGGVGTYIPTKIFNQDTTRSKWDPRRYGEWSGGAINEIREFNDNYNRYSENVDDLNKALSDEQFPERIKSLIGHTYTESKKQDAANNNDKKSWKDEDDKQAIHDIQAFLRANKINDLRAIYEEMSQNMSDEDIEDLVNRTTEETQAEDGSKIFNGPFVDKEGHRKYSNDEIREEIKHNSEELNRKLDSYLESVDAVNEATGGNLTKDQEDNLAYLHNLGKESLVRATKIMADRRKDIPAKLLFKTDKSVEQLTKENNTSDLAFEKNEDTPEGYVEVDTSLMDDSTFTNFFIKNIIMGGNIFKGFGETADERAIREKEEKNLSPKERRARRVKNIQDKFMDAQEQRGVNLNMLEKSFKDNFKGTPAERNMAAEDLFQDLWDAFALVNQAGEYYKTLDEYMENPGKVEQAKEKEEKKADKQQKEEQAKERFEGKSAKDIKAGLNNGDFAPGDMDGFLNDVEEGTIDAGYATVQAVKGAKDIQDKQNSLEGFIAQNTDANAVADARQMVQWISNSVESADEITAEALSQFDAGQLISDEEAEYMLSRGFDDARIMEEAERRKQKALDIIYGALEAKQGDDEATANIPEETQPLTFDLNDTDTGHDATTQSPSNQGKNDVPPPTPEEKQVNIITTSEAESDVAIKETMQRQEAEETNNGGTWRNATRRYGRERGANGRWHYTKLPYHETSRFTNDKESLEYKRSKAIYEFLSDPNVNAFEHVENASDDHIRPDDTIRFRVKAMPQEIFGKPFNELTDEEKRECIVVFMTSKDNVLGDLPYPYHEPSAKNNNPNKDVQLLMGLYKKVSDALIERYEKDGTLDIMADGKDGLNLKFKNGEPYIGHIYEVKMGVVEYSQERNTLNSIFTSPKTGAIRPYEIAIKVLDGQINVGQKKSVDAIGSGKVGQSYVLIPDASGRKVAVPFATPAFNAEQMKDTMLYSLLTEALSELEKYSDVEEAKAGRHKEERNRAIDTICSLLQIESPFLDMGMKDRITLRYKILGDPNGKRTITVGKDDNWKEALLSDLNGTPIQISLNKINGDISIGSRLEDYNEVIGEIAHTNLPNGTSHTVGSWFTLRNISEEGTQATTRNKYPEGETRIYPLTDGRNVAITTGNKWFAADPETGEVIEGDDLVDLTLARMQAVNKDKTEGIIKVNLNGEVRKYDVKKDKFVSEDTKPKTKVVDDEKFDAYQADAEAFMDEFFGGWNPGTVEEATGAETQPTVTAQPENAPQPETQPEGAPTESNVNIEDVENKAKSLGIVTARTQYAWNILSDDAKIGFMNGRNVEINLNGKSKTISINSIQQAIKVLQEFNAAAKRNPQGLNSTLHRKVDTSKSRKANIQKERQWLQKNLPMFNSEERLHFINGLIEIPGSEEKAWGKFEQGIITLSQRAVRGTLYHEAFHVVTQTLLSDEELNSLYENAVKHYKETSVPLVEELLAEDFRRYVQREETPIVGPILKFFRRILNAIRNISGYRAPIHQLFYRINNGEFAETLPRESRGENAFYKVRKDRLLPKDNPTHKAIEDDFKNYNWKGQFANLGKQWTRFKKAWIAKGYTPVAEPKYEAYEKSPGYVFVGVRTNADEVISKRENRKHKKRERYAAEQAHIGMREKLQWDRLDPETQMNLMDYYGIDRSRWESMSVDEQEQMQYCNG